MLHSSGLLRHVLSYVIHNYLSIRLLIHTTHNQFAHFLKLIKKNIIFPCGHALGMHKQIVACLTVVGHASMQMCKQHKQRCADRATFLGLFIILKLRTDDDSNHQLRASNHRATSRDCRFIGNTL